MRAWVEAHGDRWRVRAVVLDEEGAPRKRTLATHDDELAAQRFARAWNLRASGGAETPVTLAKWISDWLDARERDGTERGEVRGIDEERSVVRRHVLPSPLAALFVQSITRADVEDFAVWLRARRKVSVLMTKTGPVFREGEGRISAQTQRHVMRVVRGALRAAVGRLIDVSPAAEVRVKRGRAKDISEDWLRAEEIETLLACERIPARLRAAYAIAIGTGLRQGDLRALRASDVDLDCEVPGPGIRFVIAKTGEPHRVPILPWLVPHLRAHLEAVRGETWLFPSQHRDPRQRGRQLGDGYDFEWAEHAQKGRETRPAALELAGIARRIRFHDLRGTTATHLALGTWGRVWPLTEVQHFLKHSDQRVTERYVRRAHDALAAAARATPGGPGFPQNAPTESAKCPRPQQDSNLRPSAPEADAAPSVLGGLRAESSPIRPHDLAALARALVLAPSHDAVRALARAYLDSDAAARLALEVLDGGPYAVRRGIELAALVLAQAHDEQRGADAGR